MTHIGRLWSKLSPLTRGLVFFFIFNCVALNMPFNVWRHEVTALDYTKAFLILDIRDDHNDSWAAMRWALEYLEAPGEQPLYAEVYNTHKSKFQYPPTSLLFMEAFKRFPSRDLSSNSFLNLVSWLAVIGTALIVLRVYTLSVRQHLAAAGRERFTEKAARFGLAIGFTLIFYPIVRSFFLGQIQTWIIFFFAVAVLGWMTDRKGLAGVFCGLVFVIKPQLSLLLLWGLIRKQWRFVIGGAATVAVIGVVSIMTYGFANHLDYLQVLSYIARHGESFHPNQSVNGILNRVLFNGLNLEYTPTDFAPYNLWVYLGTTVSSFAIIVTALFWRRNEHQSTEVTDLFIAALSFTMASPVAWEHHYGIMLPMFAVILPATLGAARLSRRHLIVLAVAFAFSSNYYHVTHWFAATPFNFLQSYLFFAAVLLLVHLYRLRRAQWQAVEAEAVTTLHSGNLAPSGLWRLPNLPISKSSGSAWSRLTRMRRSRRSPDVPTRPA